VKVKNFLYDLLDVVTDLLIMYAGTAWYSKDALRKARAKRD
jgi:hypothetical protein